MATTAAILDILVKADTTRATVSLRRFDSALGKTDVAARQATTATGKLERSTNSVGASLGRAAKYAASAAGAYIGISQAKEAVSATTDLAKATLTLNKNLGLSIKTSSEFAAVAKARGVDTRALGMSFGTLSRQIEGAKRGATASVLAFERLGVTVKELKRNTPEQTISEVADGMAKLGAGTERTASSMTLFGRGWQTIVPILRDGSKSMQQQLALANKYGASFGGESLTSIEDLIAAERELKIAQLGLQVQFTKEIAPALIDVFLKFAQWINAIRKGKEDVKRFVSDIGQSFKDFWEKATLLRTIVQGVWRAITAIVKAAATVIKGIIKVISGVLTGNFGRAWDGVKDIFSGALQRIFGMLKAFTAPFRAAAEAIGKGLAGAFSGAWDKIKGIFQAGANTLKDIVNWIISNVINRIPGVELGLIGGGGSPTSGTGKSWGSGLGEHHFSGGKITKPMAIVGEEAPRHPEYVIATNPAYRNRNVGLWAQAGKSMGVPGFAQGGVNPTNTAGAVGGALTTASDFIGKMSGAPFGSLPGFMSGTGDWIKDRFAAYIKDKVASVADIITGGMTGHIGGTMAKAAKVANLFGLSITSGYRSPAHNAAVGGVPGSLHTHGSPSNPGAIDLVGAMSAMQSGSQWAGAHYKLLENFVHDAGSGMHLHLGFFKGGGIMGKGTGLGLGSKSQLGIDGMTTLIHERTGWAQGKSALLAAIGMAESKGVLDIVGDSGASNGPFQIHHPSWPQYSTSKLRKSWGYSIDAARNVFNTQGWGAWSTFNDGLHKPFLGGRILKSPGGSGGGGGSWPGNLPSSGLGSPWAQGAIHGWPGGGGPPPGHPSTITFPFGAGGRGPLPTGGGRHSGFGGRGPLPIGRDYIPEGVGRGDGAVGGASTQDLIDAIAALKAEIALQTAVVQTTGSIDGFQALKAFTDLLSGELGGRMAARKLTAGAGNVVRS